jgi:ribonuclease VapC
MVVDTSALLAILFAEPEAEALTLAIEADENRLLSAITLLEARVGMEWRRGSAGAEELDRLANHLGLRVVAFDAPQGDAAQAAYRRYGKGRHPAGLNLCDCCAYALAVTSGEPLLCKGGDFAQTDVPRVPWP